MILVFPQDSILTSTYLLELGAIGLEPIIYYQSSTNAANLLWARLDKSIKLDYNNQKNLFFRTTLKFNLRVLSDTVYSYFPAQAE